MGGCLPARLRGGDGTSRTEVVTLEPDIADREMGFRGSRGSLASAIAVVIALAAGVAALADAAPSAPSADNITLTWLKVRNGQVLRLFESDPVARVRITDPEARRIEVVVGATRVEHLTLPGAAPRVEIPVSVPRVVTPGQQFTLVVRVTGEDGTTVEKAFEPMTLARPLPHPIARLTAKWGSPTRVRLDWRLGSGDTGVAQFVVRRGARVLARLPGDVLFYRTPVTCAGGASFTVASVSGDEVESTPVEVKVAAGSCPGR